MNPESWEFLILDLAKAGISGWTARALLITGLVAAMLFVQRSAAGNPVTAGAGIIEEVSPEPEVLAPADSLFGRSGKLRARFITTEHDGMHIGVLARLFGDSAFAQKGIRTISLPSDSRPLSLIALLPFSAKVAGRIGSYRIGSWPSERGAPRSAAYASPHGFIEVTRENQDTYVSENFRLRDFLTKDQANVWPKYLVLQENLIDKLELVIMDLRAHGYTVKKMHVMSGFRTPQYNAAGVKPGGRASDSRHQYGDAADVYVDNNGNGRMSDLNGDGRINGKDAQLILDAAERVERAYPDLVGGGGLYPVGMAHGPFAHIDVRGTRARWVN